MELGLLILFLASAASYKEAPTGIDEPINQPSKCNGTGAPSIKCGVNEYAVPCKILCPPQSCDSPYTSYLCDPEPKCIPGCDCISGYLRDDNNVCISSEKCPGLLTLPDDGTVIIPPPEPEAQNDCTYNTCTPTCSLPSPRNCPQDSNPCDCPSGTIVSDKGGKCVQREECPKYVNCKGDYNASYTECPIGCPSTCAKPNAEHCNARCGDGNLGCGCKPGYILSETNGKCIKPEDCPGGGVCGKNETFVSCTFRCPTIYCPKDDSRFMIACSPPYPCPSGCSCKGGYRRRSAEQFECILASDCPPVKCTRPNEEWNSCPGRCYSDRCRDRGTTPGTCYGSDCDPRCVCKPGFFRNATDICVRPEKC